jgi:hypothetical protein
LLRKAGELLVVDETKKTKSVEAVEDWAFGHPSFRFDDILVDMLASISDQERALDKEKELTQVWEQCKIYDGIVKVKNGHMNVSAGSFYKILPVLLSYIKEGGNNKRLTCSLIESLSIVLNEEDLGRLKEQYGEEYYTTFIINVFMLMRELFCRDEKRMTDFYSKAELLNLHRLILLDYLMAENVMIYSLPILLKLMQKSSSNSLDYIAMQGLNKLKKLLTQQNQDIVLEVIQIFSHLARSKVDYYPNIAQTGLVEQIPRFLTNCTELVREKTLNLLGNLAKHSTQFFDDFVKYKVIGAIAATANIKYSNYDKIIKNIVYAVGNISYYNEQYIYY